MSTARRRDNLAPTRVFWPRCRPECVRRNRHACQKRCRGAHSTVQDAKVVSAFQQNDRSSRTNMAGSLEELLEKRVIARDRQAHVGQGISPMCIKAKRHKKD